VTNGRQELPQNALERMFVLQDEVQQALELQRGVPTVPLHMTDEERVVYVKNMILAAVAELVEYLDETRWKPWSSSPLYFHREAAFGEAVDLFHFAMNLAMAAAPDNVSPQDVARMLFAEYQVKNDENKRRALESYDAITDKCPSCGRDIRDLIRHMDVDHEPGDTYTCICGENITDQVAPIVVGNPR
jgi:dUTPase